MGDDKCGQTIVSEHGLFFTQSISTSHPGLKASEISPEGTEAYCFCIPHPATLKHVE
jgi:hypothetical protein